MSKEFLAKLKQNKFTDCKKRDRQFGRNIGTLSEYTGMQ